MNCNADRSDHFINFNYILPVLLRCGLLCKPLDVYGAPAYEKCQLDNVYSSNFGASPLFENGCSTLMSTTSTFLYSKRCGSCNSAMLHVNPYYCFLQ